VSATVSRNKLGIAPAIFAVVGALLPWFFYEFFQFHHFEHLDPWFAAMPVFFASCLPLTLFHGLNSKLTEPLPLLWITVSSVFDLTFILGCAFLLCWSRAQNRREGSTTSKA
jgi:hypothetical protein